MYRRHLLPATLVLAFMLNACQSQRSATILTVRQSGNEIAKVVPAANTGENVPGIAQVAITGQIVTNGTPLANAQVAAKDALTGKVLAGASSDASGSFTLDLSAADSSLVQVIATQGDNTLQAFIVASTSSTPSKYAITATSTSIKVDWGTTLVAQTLGAKLAEVFVADSPAGGRGREVVARAQELAKAFSQLKASSLAQLRRESFANPDIRKGVVAIATEANDMVLAAFREGVGEVFELSPLSVLDAALDVPAPVVIIDRAAGKVTLTIGGRTETLNIPRQTLEGKGKAVIALATTLANSPTTGLVIPSQEEIEQALARHPSPDNRGRSSGSNGSSGGSSSGSDGTPNAPSHDDDGRDRDDDPRDPKHKMWVTDVQLADSGQSIKGANAVAALSFDPEGKPIRLKLKGKLNAEHPFKLDQKDYALQGFPFAGLIQQTFVGKDPKRRVMLDDSIWLPLDPSVKPTDTELIVVLDTKALTDLAISNLHEIAIFDREDVAVAPVRVANATPVAGVQPIITQVEVVGNIRLEPKNESKSEDDDNGNHNGQNKKKDDFRILHGDDDGRDDEDKVRYLRIEGHNLPVSYYAHWAQLNGVRLYAHATWVTDENNPKTVLFLHLPEDLIKPADENLLTYANHFGFSMSRF